MKRILLLVLTLCSLPLSSKAIVNIPDVNFKQSLLNHTPIIDIDGDNEISEHEASLVTRLDLDNLGISNLTGIEAFVNLEILGCSDNNIASINTSTLTKLRYLTARNNNIRVIDVRNCALWGLRMEGNPVEYAYLEGASTFQIEAAYGINFGLDHIKYVCISQAQYGTQVTNVNHQWRFWDRMGDKLHIGCSGNPPACPIINFPDADFKQALLNHIPVIDTDGDGEICIDEASVVTLLNAEEKSISNITGIEYFSSLEVVKLGRNQISTADFSGNPKLVQVDLSRNSLTSINVSTNTLLKGLDLIDNRFLSTLDLRNNTELDSLECAGNNLSELDLSNNKKLFFLSLSINNLSSIELIDHPELLFLRAGQNQLTLVDVRNSPKLELLHLGHNQLQNLDITQNPLLRGLVLSHNKFQRLNFSNNLALRGLYLDHNEFTDIDITNHSLSTLDINDNPYLKKAFLKGNHGFYESFITFSNTSSFPRLSLGNCPNLEFVCLEHTSFYSQAVNHINVTLGYTNCVVNTTCIEPVSQSFTNYFVLAPNPTSGVMSITRLSGVTLAYPRSANILNTQGQVVMQIRLSFGALPPAGTPILIGADGNSAIIDVSSLQSGNYVLSVPTAVGTLSTHFVKQ